MGKESPVWKDVLGWILLISGFIFYTVQQSFTIFHFPSEVDAQMYLFFTFALMAGGMTSIMIGPGALTWIKNFVFAILCIYGIFFILNACGLIYDASMGTTLYGGQAYFLLSSATENVLTWEGISNIVLMCIPIALIVITVVFILVGDGPDEYMTAFIEGCLAIGFYILIAWLMNLVLGINIFAPF